MFVFNLDMVSTEGIEVSIDGPESWNAGEEISRVYRYETAGRKATWLNVFQGNDGQILNVVSGAYDVSAVISDVTHTEKVMIEASDQLSRPLGLTVVAEGTTTVGVSWEPVSGAQSYLVELFPKVTTEGSFAYTAATSAELTGLALIPGEEYRVGVTALTADFSPNAGRSLPNGMFNTSFASKHFTVY